MLDVKLGPLEWALRIEPLDGSEPYEVVTTPSEFARADEFIDSLRASGNHSERWLTLKALPATAMLAAIREGRFQRKPLTLESVAEFQNANEVYDAEVAEQADKADPDEDPTGAAPAEGREAV